MAEIEERLRQDNFEPEVAGRIGVAADGLVTELVVVKDTIYQPLMVVSRDRLAFPIRLNNRLSGLLNKLQSGNVRPNGSYYKVFDELVAELAELQTQIDVIFENQVLPFNRPAREPESAAAFATSFPIRDGNRVASISPRGVLNGRTR